MSEKQKVSLVAGLIVTLLAFIFVVHVVSNNATRSIKETNHRACIGSAQRLVAEMGIFYGVYEADYTSGQGEVSGVSLTQQRIRAAEAEAILAGMRAMVAIRVDRSYEKQFPKQLRPTIAKADFRCPSA